jgi:hypothetical protein
MMITRPAAARQAHLGLPIRANDGRIEVAVAIDLGSAQKADVDQPALQVVLKEVRHGDHRGGPRHQAWVADGQRQPGGARAVDAGFVNQLQVGGDGALRQVAGDVGQADTHEDHPHAGQLAGRGGNHHFGCSIVAHLTHPAQIPDKASSDNPGKVHG